MLRYINGVALQKGKIPLDYSTVRRRLRREVPQREQVRFREGARAFEAKCVPKIKRAYDMPAGEWWCLDGRKLDVMCRVPDDRRNWRRCRPVLTGVADLRSRMIVGWDIRATENSDGILSGIKMALRECGAPRHAILDNGLAYKAAAGSTRSMRRQRAYLQDGRIASVFTRLGITPHHSIPYHAWSKPIESLWNKVKTRFDRWFWSFWGGSPRERPEHAERLTKLRVDELPTPDDVRKAFVVFLDEYHASPQSGDGTCGLSPKLVMQQLRGPVRHVDKDLLDLLCCRMVGPVQVRRDGVRWNHVLYGQTEENVWRLYGTRVWLAIDPERADRVTLCDERGVPLCYATNRRLTDVTQEDRREAARTQAKARKVARRYRTARNVLLETSTAQILQAKRTRALAEEKAQRKQLPEPESSTVQTVRPDLTQAAKLVARKSARQALVANVDGLRDVFGRLADVAGQEEQVPTPATSAATVFDQLAKTCDDNPDDGFDITWDRLAERA